MPTIQANATNDSPIILSKVLKDSNIGYLVYNAFERGPGNDVSNFQYDIELINALRDLKSKGATELVLDLRYNPGGYLLSAMVLASALVPEGTVPARTKKVFVTEEYNKYFQDSLVNKYGQNALNEYFLDKLKVQNTTIDEEIPRMNLTRLYVIATENSASASEAVIHGLKPYMDVYHVGLTTVGKDKASITVKSSDKRILWQLQPIVSRLTDANGKGNYINGLKPNIEVSEWEECYEMADAYYEDDNGAVVNTRVPLATPWKGGFKEFGDKEEPLLAAAIAHMKGEAFKSKVKSSVSHGAAKQIPYIKGNESRFKAIIDENKFNNLDKRK